ELQTNFGTRRYSNRHGNVAAVSRPAGYAESVTRESSPSRLMTCPTTDKIEAFLDNELAEHEDREISQHLARCHSCAGAAFGSRKLKLSVKRAANSSFAPSPELQARIRRSIAPRSKSFWLPSLIFATAALAFAFAVIALRPHPHAQDLLAEAT